MLDHQHLAGASAETTSPVSGYFFSCGAAATGAAERLQPATARPASTATRTKVGRITP